MSDRTLDNRTYKSKRLAALSVLAFGLFPYIFQQTDDWGCLVADAEVIKAQRFPKIKWIDEEMIELALKEYNEVGMLFLWEEESYRYGFFIRFEMKSGRYLSKRRKRETPEPPADLLAKFLKDNNHFQSLPVVRNSSYKLSQVKLSIIIKNLKKQTTPSAVFVDNSVKESKSNPQETVEKFISGFGSSQRKDEKFTGEVKRVVIRFVERCKEWGFIIEDEQEAINKEFGWIQNLIQYGTAKKPKVLTRGFFTEPNKALKLLDRIKGKPKDARASFITAIKKQSNYLP